MSAVDPNPSCVKTAKRNILLNGLDGVIKVLEDRAESIVEEDADLLLANIHYDVIADLLHRAGFHQKEWLIIPGLLRSQAKQVISERERSHLCIVKDWEHDKTWFTMLVKHGITPSQAY